jgi:hypothetical protein
LVFGFAEKIKPDFGFHYQNNRGVDLSEDAAHDETPVERKIKNERGIGFKDLASEILPGSGRCRNDERVIGEIFQYGAGERARRLRFTDGNTVEPDYGFSLRLEFGQKSQFFPNSRGVFSFSQSVPQKARQQKKKTDRQDEAVE